MGRAVTASWWSSRWMWVLSASLACLVSGWNVEARAAGGRLRPKTARSRKAIAAHKILPPAPRIVRQSARGPGKSAPGTLARKAKGKPAARRRTAHRPPERESSARRHRGGPARTVAGKKQRPTNAVFGARKAGHRPKVARAAPGAARHPQAGAAAPSPVTDVATQLLGRPYRFGGNGQRGFDCSGFVRTVYSAVGVDLPRSAREQFRVGRRVAPGELRPGDLVFFRTYRRDASHVGIYVGGRLFVHAATRGRQVRIDSLDDRYYRRRFLGARRLPVRHPAFGPAAEAVTDRSCNRQARCAGSAIPAPGAPRVFRAGI